MPFAQPTASGSTSGAPRECHAHQSPVRPKPHWISSNMSRMPRSSHSRRSPRRNSAVAGITPISPWIGSSRMPAVCGVRTASTLARSLKVAFRKPGVAGSKPFFTFSCPVAAMPARVRPWKESWNVTTSKRPPGRVSWPNLRASLNRPSFASAPLLQKNTRPNFPMSRTMRSASSPWGRV